MMASQEMVLELLGRQLLIDGLILERQAAIGLLDRMLELSPAVAGYGLVGPDGSVLMQDSASASNRSPNGPVVPPGTFEEALQSNHLRLGKPYQPQVDVDGRVVGVEALARWNDEELGEVGPRRFIAIAEASGLISRLGDYIVDRCLAEGAVLQELFHRPLRLSINISVRQFLHEDFAARILHRFGEAGLNGVQLVLEITESLFMEDMSRIMDELEKLRMADVRISLDDFGTGFSSLSLLRSLPVDELKIDKSFIDNLERDDWARELVRSIIAIGRTHGMSLLAEGVESERQFEILREDGCDAFQGYYFGRPMPLDELKCYLAGKS